MVLQLLGRPLKAAMGSAAAYGKEKEGSRIYTVISGKPCKFYVIDAKSGQILYGEELIGSNHSWGICIGTDGSVYIGGDGRLYRYDPINRKVTDLGIAIAGETYFWRLAADRDGYIYGGTYPGGKVFQYDPAAGTFRDYGSMLEGASYARSLDAGPNGKLYVGMGSQEAAIVELDTRTGKKNRLAIPEQYASNNNFVYDLDVIGTKLFARLANSNNLLVYDLERAAWVDRIENAAGLDVSPASDNGLVYLIKDGYLHEYDPAALKLTRTQMPVKSGAKDFGWLELDEPDYPGKSLVSMYTGAYWVYNPVTQKHKSVKVELEGQPVAIQSLTLGDDGRIYIGGYFSGGFASYDPASGTLSDCKSFGQTENLKFFKGKLYLGVYPGAYIYGYDPAEMWAPSVNPKQLFSLKNDGQDRPFAFTATEDRLVIGTVPGYGELGGAITLLDPETARYELYRHVVRNQSPIALAYRNGLVYGGTSVWGGLGIDPTEKDGKLFIWDTTTRETVWEGVPVEGERAVTALAFDGRGRLWGLTSGHLFRFDTETKRIVQLIDIRKPLEWGKLTHFWRGGFLSCDSPGVIYGNCVGTLFEYHIESGRLNILETDVSLFARDFDGNLYVTRECELYRYER